MKCQVSGCGSPGVAKNFCDKHYRRWKQHGDAMTTRRPSDWGERNKHPLYQSWKWLRKTSAKNPVAEEWQDFWRFAEDVVERPSEKHSLRRVDEDRPWGPNNFYWKERLGDAKTREERNAWARKYRKANPEAVKQSELKKAYGIDLEEYYDMLDAQQGVCAICRGEQSSRYKYYSVDHCHGSGKVRGLLCSDCNRAIGLMKDDPDIIGRAAEYLRA